MNTFLTNFKEYTGLKNALCISCMMKNICRMENVYLVDKDGNNMDFCYGKQYKRSDEQCKTEQS